MNQVEASAIRYVAYGSYAVGTVGAATSIGDTLGWLMFAAAGGIPGLVLLRRELDERAIERDRRTVHGAPARQDAGAAPDPLGTPGEVPPAY